jgi:glycosyltransferase involved in cell wall biosynthesis
MTRTSSVQISVVIPLLNEVESLPELHRLLTETLQAYAAYEIIFVDDGSRDGSLKVLQELHAADTHVRVISFRKNYGKSAALSVGFARARGEYIVTMDADLQDDPAEIPNLMRKAEEGWDLVSGWKKVRHDPMGKTLPSKLFNFVTGLMSGLRLHDFNCGLKIYRHEVVEELPVYGEMHRFLPALAHFDGYRVTEIPVKHHPRKYGKTKFGASRFLNGFLDLVTVLFLVKYLKKPLHLFGLAGLGLGMAGFLILGWLSWGWFHGIWIGNRPIFFLGFLLLVFGAQVFSLGLIAEMMTRAQADRREYSCRLLLGFDGEGQ